MRILIAPDKFKGSLGAREVAAHIAVGLREALPNAQIEIVPVADGGEGTASVISNSLNGAWIGCDAHDPLGRAIKSRFAWIAAEKLAVFEMSEAAGLRRLAANERNPARTNTFGVGEMLLEAAARGAERTIVALGGSATNDGGFGMACALGYRFYAGNSELTGGVDGLQDLTRIAKPKDVGALATARAVPENRRSPRRVPLHVIAAADVRNPLLGERGATRVFAPQKGATPEQIELLEAALTQLANVAARDLQCDFRNEPGAGAAGGLGFGLMTFCGATMRSGFEVVAEKIQLEELIRKVDVVISGEGSLDRQTLEGKAPAGVARLARENGKRIFAITGKSSGDREVEELFEEVFSLRRDSMSEAESIKRAPELLRKRARELANLL